MVWVIQIHTSVKLVSSLSFLQSIWLVDSASCVARRHPAVTLRSGWPWGAPSPPGWEKPCGFLPFGIWYSGRVLGLGVVWRMLVRGGIAGPCCPPGVEVEKWMGSFLGGI